MFIQCVLKHIQGLGTDYIFREAVPVIDNSITEKMLELFSNETGFEQFVIVTFLLINDLVVTLSYNPCIILYVSIISPLALLYSRLGKFRFFSLSV